MYEIPSEFLYPLHHVRSRFKKDRENVFGNMAFSIAELDGKSTKDFKTEIEDAIKIIMGEKDANQKTVDNWRTEITTLFSMKQEDNGKVYATDITKELANSSNLTRFFLRAMLTFQYPGGFLTSDKIKNIVDANIIFNPLLWLSNFFTFSNESNTFYITELEFCYCVLNDLRVTSKHEDISLTYSRILENRRNNTVYSMHGDTKRYAGDILDYCVLADILYKDKSKKFRVKESALPLLQFFKSNYVLFTSYSHVNSLSQISSLKNLWINFVNSTSTDILLRFSMENSDSTDNNFVGASNLKQPESDEVDSNSKIPKPENLNKLAEKIDNNKTGNTGELLAQMHEKIFLQNANLHKLCKRVQQIPDHLAVGYDILSRNTDATMKQIEVKTTVSKRDTEIHRVHLTENEWNAAESHRDRYYIYRIALSEDTRRIRIIKDPYGLYQDGKIKICKREGVDLIFDNTCYEEVDLLEYTD